MTKPTKRHVRPAKARISLGIRPVWSESSLSAWRNIGPLTTYWPIRLSGCPGWSESSLGARHFLGFVVWRHSNLVTVIRLNYFRWYMIVYKYQIVTYTSTVKTTKIGLITLSLWLLYNPWLTVWAASSEFVSSSIPSWQILTTHAQPFRGARDLAFCLKVPLDSLLVWARSGDSGETARMRRLAWTLAARIGDKYQIRLTRSI